MHLSTSSVTWATRTLTFLYSSPSSCAILMPSVLASDLNKGILLPSDFTERAGNVYNKLMIFIIKSLKRYIHSYILHALLGLILSGIFFLLQSQRDSGVFCCFWCLVQMLTFTIHTKCRKEKEDAYKIKTAENMALKCFFIRNSRLINQFVFLYWQCILMTWWENDR